METSPRAVYTWFQYHLLGLVSLRPGGPLRPELALHGSSRIHVNIENAEQGGPSGQGPALPTGPPFCPGPSIPYIFDFLEQDPDLGPPRAVSQDGQEL